jgi:hypothetical protein
MPNLAARAIQGLAAGCVGLVALELTSYLDQYLRARPASESPVRLGERLGDQLGLDLGEGEARANRASALGPLAGYWDGLLLGVLGGVAMPRDGWLVVTAAALTAGAMTGSNGPLIALGITDPRTWTREDWLSDVIPHLAYGLVTTATLAALRPAERPR